MFKLATREREREAEMCSALAGERERGERSRGRRVSEKDKEKKSKRKKAVPTSSSSHRPLRIVLFASSWNLSLCAPLLTYLRLKSRPCTQIKPIARRGSRSKEGQQAAMESVCSEHREQAVVCLSDVTSCHASSIAQRGSRFALFTLPCPRQKLYIKNQHLAGCRLWNRRDTDAR